MSDHSSAKPLLLQEFYTYKNTSGGPAYIIISRVCIRDSESSMYHESQGVMVPIMVMVTTVTVVTMHCAHARLGAAQSSLVLGLSACPLRLVPVLGKCSPIGGGCLLLLTAAKRNVKGQKRNIKKNTDTSIWRMSQSV